MQKLYKSFKVVFIYLLVCVGTAHFYAGACVTVYGKPEPFWSPKMWSSFQSPQNPELFLNGQYQNLEPSGALSDWLNSNMCMY